MARDVMQASVVSILLSSFILFLVPLLTSCGDPICIAGLGDCDAFNSSPTSDQGTQISTVKLELSPARIKINETATVKVSGGNGPYTFDIDEERPRGSIKINGPGSNQATYYPENTDQPYDERLRVKDRDGKAASRTIEVVLSDRPRINP